MSRLIFIACALATGLTSHAQDEPSQAEFDAVMRAPISVIDLVLYDIFDRDKCWPLLGNENLDKRICLPSAPEYNEQTGAIHLKYRALIRTEQASEFRKLSQQEIFLRMRNDLSLIREHLGLMQNDSYMIDLFVLLLPKSDANRKKIQKFWKKSVHVQLSMWLDQDRFILTQSANGDVNEKVEISEVTNR